MRLIQLTDEQYEHLGDGFDRGVDDFEYLVGREGDDYTPEDIATFRAKTASVNEALGHPLDADLADVLSWLGTICEEWDGDEMLSDQGRSDIGALLKSVLELDVYPALSGTADPFEDEVERYFANPESVRARIQEIKP